MICVVREESKGNGVAISGRETRNSATATRRPPYQLVGKMWGGLLWSGYALEKFRLWSLKQATSSFPSALHIGTFG
jgi:hypothetical protein